MKTEEWVLLRVNHDEKELDQVGKESDQSSPANVLPKFFHCHGLWLIFYTVCSHVIVFVTPVLCPRIILG
jgi:hypothetical protein